MRLFRVLCLTAFIEISFGVQYILFPYICICFVGNIWLVGIPLTFKHILKYKWILELFTFLPRFLGGILEKWDCVLTVIYNYLASKIGIFLGKASLPFGSLLSSVIVSLVLRTELIIKILIIDTIVLSLVVIKMKIDYCYLSVVEDWFVLR